MENLQVAWILDEMADLLELKGENPFKISAYRRGADMIEGLREPLPLVAGEKRLLDLPGIGKALARDIEEILERGTCTLHEELLQEIPPGLVQLLEVPGIGPKKALLFYEELNIQDISQLEEAAKRKRLRRLKGIGAKTEFQIVSAIERLRFRSGKVLLQLATTAGEELMKRLNSQPHLLDMALVGGVRRREEMVEGIEILISAPNPPQLLEGFKLLPELQELTFQENGDLELTLREGLKAFIKGVTPEDYPYQLHRLTGSSRHLELLSDLAAEGGFSLQEEGLFQGEEPVTLSSEEEIYQVLQLPYILPELRQGKEELQAAEVGLLPQSIHPDDIRGDLHIHTSWSDGGHTIEEMVEGAMERNYEYVAICDHSPSLKVARGLSLERLKKQMDLIERLNQNYHPFRILQGVEVDILRDGRLDYPDSILSQLDIVVASIHTSMKQDRDTLTRRLLSAIENPYVHIIGHPQGRILGYRDPYPVDMQQLFEAVLRHGKVLEINGAPHRLDLPDHRIKEAREQGIPLVINTDAHSVEQLHYMDLGVFYARRGYLEKKDVINTYSLTDLLAFLSYQRS